VSRRLALAALLVGVAGELFAFAYFLHADGPNAHLRLEVWTTVAFLLAVVGLWRSGLSNRNIAIWILLVGTALQVIALTRSPQTSDDDYRYIWDGKVQLSGTDPYRYTPAGPELSHLRNAPSFGPDGPCTWDFPGGCTAINRPTVHTVYPPVAEAAFVVVRLASFGGHGLQLPFQIAGAVGSLLVGLVLMRRARQRGDPLWLVALWAWCPITVSEFGNNAHIDWLAVLFCVLGLTAYSAGRLGRAGVLIGAAIATKLYPGLLLASMLKRRPVLVVTSAIGFVLLTYLPHVVAVGSSVIGYLPGYLHEEGYSNGSHLLLLGAVLPHPIDTIAGALIVALAGAVAWRRSDPLHPEATAVVVMGVAFLVATPRYGWYGALLVTLIVMSRRIEWLPVAFSASFAYLNNTSLSDEWIYAICAGLTLLGLVARYGAGRRETVRQQTRRDRDVITGERATSS